jgi:hypothetical protein
MGRHKHPDGERKLVVGRIPVDYDRKLVEFLEASSKYRYRGDLVADLLVDFLDRNAPEQATGQTTLDDFDELRKAS